MPTNSWMHAWRQLTSIWRTWPPSTKWAKRRRMVGTQHPESTWSRRRRIARRMQRCNSVHLTWSMSHQRWRVYLREIGKIRIYRRPLLSSQVKIIRACAQALYGSIHHKGPSILRLTWLPILRVLDLRVAARRGSKASSESILIQGYRRRGRRSR